MDVIGVSPTAAGVRGLRTSENIFIMQNPTFWCILGSENGQLLTSANPEGTAGGGLGGEGEDAEGIKVRGAISAEPKI